MNLSICFFDKQHPQFVPIASREHRGTIREAGEVVVNSHFLPLPVFTELDHVHSSFVVVLRVENTLNQSWSLCHCRNGAEEPAITQLTLNDVVWLDVLENGYFHGARVWVLLKEIFGSSPVNQPVEGKTL